jgi:hypothetical protein
MKSLLPSPLTGSLLLSAAMTGETGLSTGALINKLPMRMGANVGVPAGNKLLIQSSAFLYCIGLRQGSGPQIGEK